MADLDLAQVLQTKIKDAGFSEVFYTLPDSRKHAEFVVLSFGTPKQSEIYYDFSEEIPIRVSVLCKRISELDAMNDAQRIKELFEFDPPESANGSFVTTSLEVDNPRPLVWDESGRFVWVFDMHISIERNTNG